jgi:hypothetical protein
MAKDTTKPARRKPGPKPKAETAAADAAAPAAAAAPAPKGFVHGLRDAVTIAQSGETGTVRARAEWATGNLCYMVAYTTKLGEFREAWLDQDLLAPIAERRKPRPPRAGK